MGLFYTTDLAVPLFQVMLLLIAITGALLFGRTKLALITTYVFTLYWGYVYNSELFDPLEKPGMLTAIYFGFGICIVLLATFAFIARRE